MFQSRSGFRSGSGFQSGSGLMYTILLFLSYLGIEACVCALVLSIIIRALCYFNLKEEYT